MSSVPSVPSPVIFSHAETLHAIPLPPLASFLVSLHKAEHLSKLNDILDRYRTPKSYHRVDIRLVQSSELPPGSPESFTSKERLGSREPIELDEGVGLNAFLEQHPNIRQNAQESQNTASATIPPIAKRSEQPQINDDPTKSDHQANDVGHLEKAPSPATAPLDGPDSPELLEQIVSTRPRGSQQPEPVDTFAQDSPRPSETGDGSRPPSSPPLEQITFSPVKSPLIPAQDRLPSPPIPLHSLPPSGPKRRVRELRLDLRSLDAAALFALETWRREEMGLGKLEMEFPDSVWYKDPTPTPTPSPQPQSIALPKKRGRPRKDAIVQAEPIVAEYGETAESDAALGPDVGEPSETLMTEVQAEKYKNMVDALKSNGETREVMEQAEPVIKVLNIIGSLDELARLSPKPNTEQPESQAGFGSEIAPTTIAESLDQVQVSLPSPQSIPVDTPSPDVLLNDAFNEKEDDDPDFIPAASPPARGGRPRRSGQLGLPGSASAGNEVVVGLNPPVVSGRKRGRPPKIPRVSFESSPVEITPFKANLSVEGDVHSINTESKNKSEDDNLEGSVARTTGEKRGVTFASQVDMIPHQLGLEQSHPSAPMLADGPSVALNLSSEAQANLLLRRAFGFEITTSMDRAPVNPVLAQVSSSPVPIPDPSLSQPGSGFNISGRKRQSGTLEAVEISNPKRIRTSLPLSRPMPILSNPHIPPKRAKNRRVVVEVPSARPSTGDEEDSDDEEWDFLRGLG